MKRSIVVTALVVLALQFLSVKLCLADVPGDHPRFMRALTDLRLASGYLEDFTPSKNLNEQLIIAITEIDAAIKEKHLSKIDDGEDTEFHPPIDNRLNKAARYQKALDLLTKIRKDISGSEDKTFADGLQARVSGHINKALATVENIITKSNFPGRHPSYLAALSFLREARENLNKITPDMRVDNNELNAIGEINAAMGDIKTAAIDSGMDITDFSAAAVSMRKADRYNKALDLLNKAFTAINLAEDNEFAKSPQKMALRHINNALDIIQRGSNNTFMFFNIK